MAEENTGGEQFFRDAGQVANPCRADITYRLVGPLHVVQGQPTNERNYILASVRGCWKGPYYHTFVVAKNLRMGVEQLHQPTAACAAHAVYQESAM